MNKVMTLYRGTSIESGKKLLEGNYEGLTWWAHDYETLSHYYEGCVIKMTIELVDFDKVSIYGYDFIYNLDEVDEEELKHYKYGYSHMACPDATWYSINSNYLYKHKIKMEEIDYKEAMKELYNL